MAAKQNKSLDPASAVQPDRRVFCPMQSSVLHHVSLFVSDMEVSTRFYTEGLGLTLREEFEDIIGLRGAHRFPFTVASIFLEAGEGRYIELHPAGDGEMSPPGFPMNHLAIAVLDVDAAYAQALAFGGARFDIPIPNEEWDGTPLDVIMSGPRPEPMRMAFLQGPSGELIELYQASNI
ncbi:VOC family protein [Tateyamaria sp. SN3-11]|uniref:VOC family protein n=1 Tax=Tateyamaria sp. SN3-11 TaxID=3092147 RepID=UPI0039E744DB